MVAPRPELAANPDRLRWNAKYLDDFTASFLPHPLAERALSLPLPAGPVLDLASGPSGSALLAAAAGRRCDAVDASDVALGMLAREAHSRGLAGLIRLVHADLGSWRPEPSSYAFVLCTGFWDRGLFTAAAAAVQPGGLLGWEALSAQARLTKPSVPASWCLAPGEPARLLPDSFGVLEDYLVGAAGSRRHLLARRQLFCFRFDRRLLLPVGRRRRMHGVGGLSVRRWAAVLHLAAQEGSRGGAGGRQRRQPGRLAPAALLGVGRIELLRRRRECFRDLRCDLLLQHLTGALDLRRRPSTRPEQLPARRRSRVPCEGLRSRRGRLEPCSRLASAVADRVGSLLRGHVHLRALCAVRARAHPSSPCWLGQSEKYWPTVGFGPPGRQNRCMTSFIWGWRLAVSAGAVLCLGIAACSSGSGHPAAHATKATHSFVQPATGPAADAAVKAMWQTFFNGTVPIPRRLGLLQDSQRFSSFVKSEEKTSLGALVLAASGKVTKVAVTAPGKASVTFTILLGGKPIAKNLSGTAVYSGGRWLVAASSFCGLLHKAYGKKLHTLPAACGT